MGYLITSTKLGELTSVCEISSARKVPCNPPTENYLNSQYLIAQLANRVKLHRKALLRYLDLKTKIIFHC